MDGVRMGSRSSTRHGPAAVFQGPVRRWRKSWTPIPSASATHAGSRVLLYKWSPISGNKDEAAEENATHSVRYSPASVILAKREEFVRTAAAAAAIQIEDDNKASEEETNMAVDSDAKNDSDVMRDLKMEDVDDASSDQQADNLDLAL